MTSDWHMLTEVGALAGTLITMYFFLQYVRHRDEENKQLVGRMEGIAKQFDESVREGRREQREITNALLGIQKETITSVGHLSERVGSLEVTIQKLPMMISNKPETKEPKSE